VRLLAFEEPPRLHREVFSIAVGARRAVYSDFELTPVIVFLLLLLGVKGPLLSFQFSD